MFKTSLRDSSFITLFIGFIFLFFLTCAVFLFPAGRLLGGFISCVIGEFDKDFIVKSAKLLGHL